MCDASRSASADCASDSPTNVRWLRRRQAPQRGYATVNSRSEWVRRSVRLIEATVPEPSKRSTSAAKRSTSTAKRGRPRKISTVRLATETESEAIIRLQKQTDRQTNSHGRVATESDSTQPYESESEEDSDCEFYTIECILGEEWQQEPPVNTFLCSWVGYGPEHDCWVSSTKMMADENGRQPALDEWYKAKKQHEAANTQRFRHVAKDLTWSFRKIVQEIKARTSPFYRHEKGQVASLQSGKTMANGNTGAFRHKTFRTFSVFVSECTMGMILSSQCFSTDRRPDITKTVTSNGVKIGMCVFEDVREFLYE